MAVGTRAREKNNEEWRRQVGWLYPARDVHRRFRQNPREREGKPLAWWRLVGPETRCPLRWRRDLKVVSVYAFSSTTFAACGLAAFHVFGAPRFDMLLLCAVAVTSWQADVTYLGIDHGWRTLDTVLAVVLVMRYVALALRRLALASWAHGAAFPPFVLALLCFLRSQRSNDFEARARLQALWHFALQASLVVLLRAESYHLT